MHAVFINKYIYILADMFQILNRTTGKMYFP